MEPRDVFISHAEQDGDVAIGLARALREQGHTFWVYEEGAVPRISHLIQSSKAIEACRSFLLIASANSPAVTREVEQAQQAAKVLFHQTELILLV